MKLEGRTLLTADWVLGHRDGRHVLLPKGEIVIEGDRIIFAGHAFPGEVAKRIDFGAALLSPGFVDLDALSDLDTTILSFDNHPAWRTGRVWPESYVARGPFEMYAQEELAFQKRYAFQRLIRNGVTTALPIASLFYRAWGETVAEFEAAATAAEELGLRVYLGPGYRTGNPVVVDGTGATRLDFDEERGLAELGAAVEFCRRNEGRAGDLVRTMLAPDRIETCTERLLRRTADVGRDLGVPTRLHAAQGDFERETVRRLHGMTSIEWLDSLGFLDARTLLPHGTHLSPSRAMQEPGRDLDILLERGSAIVHCPLVAARFGDALDTMPRLKAAGLRMGLGTDTSPPDVILNMQVGLLLGRVLEKSATACRAEDYFDLATTGGADALGRRDLGRLEAGAKADIVAIALDEPALGQVIDPIQTILLSGSGRDVRSVIINGRMVMFDRVIPGVDEATETRRAQAQFDRLVALYPERTYGHPPVADIFRPAYPIIAAQAFLGV